MGVVNQPPLKVPFSCFKTTLVSLLPLAIKSEQCKEISMKAFIVRTSTIVSRGITLVLHYNPGKPRTNT